MASIHTGAPQKMMEFATVSKTRFLMFDGPPKFAINLVSGGLPGITRQLTFFLSISSMASVFLGASTAEGFVCYFR